MWPHWGKLQLVWDGMLAFLLVPLDGVGDIVLSTMFLATRVPLYVALVRYGRLDASVWCKTRVASSTPGPPAQP